MKGEYPLTATRNEKFRFMTIMKVRFWVVIKEQEVVSKWQ
jgi:hypothetical protein